MTPPPRWPITWRDRVWTENDVTGVHVLQLIKVLGDDWKTLDPRTSPGTLITWLIVLTGMAAEVVNASAAEILGALPVQED